MAGDQELQLKVTLVDQASPQLKQLRDAMNHLNQQAAAGHKQARTEAEALSKELTKIFRQIKEVGTALGEMKVGALGGLPELFSSAARAIGPLGAGVAGLGVIAYGAIKIFGELNEQLSEFANKINSFNLSGRSIGVSGGVIDSITEQMKAMGIGAKEGEQAFSNFIQTITKASRVGTPEWMEVGKFQNPQVMRQNIEQYRREIASGQYSRALTEAAQNINKRYLEELARTGSSAEATEKAKDTARTYGIPVDVARRIAERTGQGRGLHEPSQEEIKTFEDKYEKASADIISSQAGLQKALEAVQRTILEKLAPTIDNWTQNLTKLYEFFNRWLGGGGGEHQLKGPAGDSFNDRWGGMPTKFGEFGSFSSRLDPNLVGEVEDRRGEHQDALQENTDQLKRLNDFLGAPGGAGAAGGGALGLLGGGLGGGGGAGMFGRGGVGGLGAGSGGGGGMARGPGGIGGGGNLGIGSGAEERFGVEGKDLKWYHSMMPKGEEALFKAREKFDDELKDPAVRDLFAARMASEVGGQGPETAQKFAEEVQNRALARGQTLRQALEGKDRYYPSVMTGGSVTGENRKRFDEILQKSRTSNLIKWGTGNASGHVGFGKGGFETSRATAYRGGGAAGADLDYLRRFGGHSTINLHDVPGGTTEGGLPPFDAEFAHRLRLAGEAYQRETGNDPRYGEMTRDFATQAEYYRRYRSGTGGIAAHPGSSRHEGGGAIDLPSSGFRSWLYRHGSAYGVHFPVRGDAPHAQPIPGFHDTLDRSALDRAAGPVTAKIDGGADINVNVAAPPGTSVSAKRRGIFRKQTVSRQTQMQPAQSGPSMSEETVP